MSAAAATLARTLSLFVARASRIVLSFPLAGIGRAIARAVLCGAVA